jgi:hypothetical protein
MCASHTVRLFQPWHKEHTLLTTTNSSSLTLLFRPKVVVEDKANPLFLVVPKSLKVLGATLGGKINRNTPLSSARLIARTLKDHGGQGIGRRFADATATFDGGELVARQADTVQCNRPKATGMIQRIRIGTQKDRRVTRKDAGGAAGRRPRQAAQADRGGREKAAAIRRLSSDGHGGGRDDGCRESDDERQDDLGHGHRGA